MRHHLKALPILILLTCAGAALAQSPEEQGEKHFQDGSAFFEKGQYERASYHLDKAYKLGQKWQYLEIIAKTWLALENYENAAYALDAYLRKGGSNIPAAKKAWAKKQLEDLGKLKEYQANKAAAEVHFKNGRDLYGKGEYEKAAIELEQAYDLSPSWEYLDLTGRTETALENYDRAIAAFEKFLTECGEKATGAQRAAVKKQLEEVEALVKLDKDKEEAASHFDTGKKDLDKGDYGNAVKSLELAYGLYPNWEYLVVLGEALAGDRSYRRAIEAYSTYLQKGGGNVPDGQRKDVTAEIDRLSKLAAEEGNAQQSKNLEQRGILLMKDKQYTSAMVQFQQAYELDPNIVLFIDMGQADEGLGKYRDAVELYKRYLAEGGAGIPKAKKDEVEARIAALEKKIDGQATRAKAVSCFRLGVMFYDQGLFEKAANELNKAYEIDPDYRILPRIAETEAALKNYDRAAAMLQRYLDDGDKQLDAAAKASAKKRIAYFETLGRGGPEDKDAAAGRLPDDYDTERKPNRDDELEDVLAIGRGGQTEDMEAKAPVDLPKKKREAPSYDWDPKTRRWTWVVGGLGVVSLLGAIVTGSVAHSEQAKIDDVCPVPSECDPQYIDSVRDRADTVDNLRITTKVLATFGTAAVVSGVTLFFVEPLFGKKHGARVSLIPWAEDRDAGLTVVGRF
jgi:tetratricopeptide (TPR) repeat protein